MAAKKAVKNQAPKLRFTVNHALADLYVVLLFTLFPLYLSEFYSAARRDKFWVFVILSAVMGIAVAAVTLTTYLSRNNAYNRKLNTYHDPLKFNVTDYAFGAFVAISIISTFASGNIAHCFMGLSGTKSNGRNMGLLMILMMFVCYAVISRYFFNKKFVFYAIFLGITVVSFVAIVNYYYWDILNIFSHYKSNKNVQQNFTSTIGNKNYLSALICVALPFSVGMAISSKDLAMRIVAYVSTGIQFMGLLVATSDGGFLGCFAAIAAILVISSRELKKLMRFFLCLAIMMFSSKILWLAEIITKNGSKGYTSFSDFFVNNHIVFAIGAVSLAVFAGLYLLGRMRSGFEIPKYVFYICLGLVCLAVLVFAALFVYYTFIDTKSKLTGMKRFFRFDERWGTHRGYFWIKSFEVFGEMSFAEKLIGAGPETFYFKFIPYFSEMNKLFAESSTNSAHNVYVNYLITHGILGLGAYLALIGSALYNAFRRAKENPLSFVCAGVILAYAVQDIVNIANPVNTPWLIAFIALSEATALRANSPHELAENRF
ncbi:MAG: O-antigen ligase family protein [Ruminococcus sp.]|nr:O-antigen ligase family protein [Ruminococcus sp.]